MSFYDEAQVSETIFYISAFSTINTEGLKGLLRLLTREREQRSASLVVLDGVFALEEASENEAEFRRIINELGNLASITRTTILLLTNSRRGPENPEYTMVDGWIELGQEQVDYRSFRFLQVRKSRGSDSRSGRHQTVITDEGLRVYPRLESTAGIVRRVGRRPKLPTGISGLDAMLQGGIEASAMTVVGGPTGVGKTSLGLHFVGQSTVEEPGLIFGFYEDERDLVQKGTSLGIAMQKLLDSGALEIVWFPPVEALIDELAYKLLDAVRKRRAARLLVDGMEAFRQSALYPERLGRFFTALTNELRSAGTATLFTLEQSYGNDLTTHMAPVSAVAEYIIVLRYAEGASEIRRTLTIRKSRRSHFDPRIREFAIGENGITLGDTIGG